MMHVVQAGAPIIGNPLGGDPGLRGEFVKDPDKILNFHLFDGPQRIKSKEIRTPTRGVSNIKQNKLASTEINKMSQLTRPGNCTLPLRNF